MLESRLSETQNQRLALESLYLELSRNRDERILAEVEQILLVGSQQLQLAGNLKAALIALESADSRLQRADSAQFTSLRRAIRRDIERLKAAPYVDVVGMSLRLDTLAHQAASFPLAMDERPARGAARRAATATRAPRRVWPARPGQDIKGLIRVQPTAAGEVPLLSPDQQFFLRENLRMRLLSARVALLAHDPTSFKADTRSAARLAAALLRHQRQEGGRGRDDAQAALRERHQHRPAGHHGQPGSRARCPRWHASEGLR